VGHYSLCSVKFIKRNDLNFYALAKTISYNPKYPLIKDLRAKAKRRITKFVFEYLDGGCNKDINLYKNTSELRKVELKPKYLIPFSHPILKTEFLFNHQFAVQFFEIINNTNNTLKPIEKQTNNSIFLNFIILTLIIISTTYLINFKK